MVCVAVVKFPQASVIVYVLVTTIGQVPTDVSALVTTKVASEVQASAIVNPIPSKAVTVVTAAGAAVAEHPSAVAGVIVPVTTGAVVS
jgi:hypothetical protein